MICTIDTITDKITSILFEAIDNPKTQYTAQVEKVLKELVSNSDDVDSIISCYADIRSAIPLDTIPTEQEAKNYIYNLKNNTGSDSIGTINTGIGKFQDTEELKERLEVLTSYLSKHFGSNVDLLTLYIKWVQSELINNIIFKTIFDENGNKIKTGVIKSDAEFNLEIRRFLVRLLANNIEYLRQNNVTIIADDIIDQINFINEYNRTSEVVKNLNPVLEVSMQSFVEKISNWMANNFANKDISGLNENDKYAYFNYVLLSNFDNGLIHAFDNFITISKPYFNIFSADKPPYSTTPTNAMQTTFNANEEDINDMDEIPNFIKIVVSTLPKYKYDKQTNTVKLSEEKLSFDGFIRAKAEIWDLIHKHKDLLKSYNVTRDTYILKELFGTEVGNLISNIYFKNKPGVTLYDIITRIQEDPQYLIPYILYKLFNSEDGLLFKNSNVFGSWSIDNIDNLYSAYKGIFDLTLTAEQPSFARMSLDNSVNDYTSNINLFNYFSLLWISTEKLYFIGYRYNRSTGCYEITDLEPRGVRYQANEFSRRINNLNAADLPIILKIKDDGTIDFKVLPSTIQVKLIYSDKSFLHLQLTYNNTNGKSVTVNIDPSSGSIKDAKNLDLKSIVDSADLLEILKTVIPISDSTFKAIYNDDSAKAALQRTGLAIFARRIINEIVRNGHSVADNYTSRIPDTRKDAVAEFKLFGIKGQDQISKNYPPSLNMVPATIAYGSYRTLVEKLLNISGIDTSTMIEDGAGNLMNNNKCSQVANKIECIWAENTKDQNNPASHFLVYDCFRGGKVIRDVVDSRGIVTKSTKLNPYENWTANVLYDFIGAFNLKGKPSNPIHIGITGPVVSDKPFVPRIMTDVRLELNYVLKKGGVLEKLIDSNDKSTTIEAILNQGNLSTLNQLLRYELYEYYSKLLNFVKSLCTLATQTAREHWTEISKFIVDLFGIDPKGETLIFNPLTNFQEFNLFVDKLLENTGISRKTFVNRLIHKVVALNNNIQFIDNLVYYLKNGRIQTNPLLIEYNLRYFAGNEINDDISTILTNRLNFGRAEWTNIDINNLRAYGELYFDEIASVFISDLIKKNWRINSFSYDILNYRVPNKNLDDPEAIKHYTPKFIQDIDKAGWIDGHTIYNSIITYTHLVNGEELTETIKISGLSNLLQCTPYQELLRYAQQLQKDNSTSPIFDLHKVIYSDPAFDIATTINILNDSAYQEEIKLYRIKRALYDYYYNELKTPKSKTEFIDTLLKSNPSLSIYLEAALKEVAETFVLNPNDSAEDYERKKQNYLNNLLAKAILLSESNLKLPKKTNDYIKQKENEANYNSVAITFNPFLLKYNTLSLLINQEYLNSSVGTHLNHPIKGSNLKNIETNCIGAQVKRNVTFSATKHEYLLNSLRGIPAKLRIAIVENLEEGNVYNILGDGIEENKTPKLMGDDGATYVYGPMSYLENWSLESEAVGQDKKQFGSMHNPESGTGFILKTAGFPLTCDRIRNSAKRALLNKKMGSIPWTSATYINYTKDFNGKAIDFDAMNIYVCGHIVDEQIIDNKRVGKLNNWPLLDNDGILHKRFFKVVDVSINANGETVVTYKEVMPDGSLNNNAIKDNKGIINTNYQLWNDVFGGAYSAEYHDGLLTYNDCDAANYNLALMMNKVGNFRSDNILKNSNNLVLSQTVVQQPLKEAMVAYAATTGAVKQGAANINSTQVYTDPNYALNTMILIALDLGVQLDAEHSVEETAIALMTLVINALSARGYSLERGNDVYEALKTITMLAIQESFVGFETNELDEVKESIAETIINSLKRSDITDSNLLQVISNNIRNNTIINNKFEVLRKTIPVDDPAILRKVLSNLAVAIQKSAIKLRVNGNQLVLVPSDGLVYLYDGKLLSEYGTAEQAMAYLTAKQSEIDKALDNDIATSELVTSVNDLKENTSYLINGKEVNLGSGLAFSTNKRTYSRYVAAKKVYTINKNINVRATDLEIEASYHYKDIDGQTKSITLSDPFVYWDFLRKVRLNNLKVVKDITKPHDLGCENCTFKLEGTNQTFNIWDLKSIHDKWNIEIRIKQLESLLEDKTITNEDRNTYNKELSERKQQRIDFQKQLQNDLWVLGGNQGEVEVITYGSTSEGATDVTIKANVDQNFIIYKPFEAIIPKVFKTEFGLTDDDNLSEIVNNKYFFLLKFIGLINSATVDCDLSLIGAKYTKNLIYEPNLQKENYTLKGFTELKNIQTYSEKGKVYRINEITGLLMYTLPIDKDGNLQARIFYDGKGNEVIVTNRPDFFINQKEHTVFKFGNSDHVLNLIDTLNKHRSKDSNINTFIERLLIDGEDSALTELHKINAEYNKDVESLQNPNLNDWLFGFFITLLSKISQLQYGSFIDSLKFIASRTPAQCHQSFMAMKCVAFDTSHVNSAQVSRWQLWLQGSDFDIDKVNIMTSSIKNGVMIGWSPLQDYSLDEEVLDAVNLTPFPTGKTIFNEFIRSYEKFSEIPLVNELASYIRNGKDITSDKITLTKLSELIRYINKHNVYLDSEDSAIQVIVDLINKHNNYFKDNPSVDIIAACQNFISRNIYYISLNPRNWILGQTSVDVVTGPWKALAAKQKLALESGRFTGRSVASIYQLLMLTLEGKLNVAISASALKVFECLSHSVNSILANGTPEEIDTLAFDIKVATEQAKMIANAWAAPEIMERLAITNPEIHERLTALNLLIDAYTELSAFLSLAADNAKDPTLSKINASISCISLYTTGMMLGIPREILVSTISSPTGLLTNELLSGNIFSHQFGLYDLKAVRDYINQGPFSEKDAKNILTILEKVIQIPAGSELNRKTLNIIFGNIKNPGSIPIGMYILRCINSAELYLADRIKSEKIENPDNETIGSNDKIFSVSGDPSTIEIARARLEEITNNEDFIKFRDKTDVQDEEKTSQSYINYQNLLKEYLGIKDYLSGKINRKPTIIKNKEAEIGNLIAAFKLIPYSELVTLKKNFYFKELEYLKHLREILLDYNEVTIIKDDNSTLTYNRMKWWDINNLIKVSIEMRNLQRFTTLNKGLPGTFEELLEFAHFFENLLANTLKVSSQTEDVGAELETLKKLNEKYLNLSPRAISMQAFIYDKAYRDLVLTIMDKIKYAINPLRIIMNDPHYSGYLTSFYILLENSKLLSATYRAILKYETEVISRLGITDKDKKVEVVKNMFKYFNMLKNRMFFTSVLKDFKFDYGEIIGLSLTTLEGRDLFVEKMDNEVIPYLKKNLENNIFILSLFRTTIDKTPYHRTKTFYCSNINSMPKTDAEKELFRKAKADLEKLRSFEIRNVPATQLLFLYNIITQNNEYTGMSLAPFFEDIRANRKDIILNLFDDFTSSFSDTKAFDEIGPDSLLNMDDLLRFCAPIVNAVKDTTKLYKYAYFKDSNLLLYVLLHKVDEKSTGEPNPDFEDESEYNGQTEIDMENIIEDQDGENHETPTLRYINQTARKSSHYEVVSDVTDSVTVSKADSFTTVINGIKYNVVKLGDNFVYITTDLTTYKFGEYTLTKNKNGNYVITLNGLEYKIHKDRNLTINTIVDVVPLINGIKDFNKLKALLDEAQEEQCIEQ